MRESCFDWLKLAFEFCLILYAPHVNGKSFQLTSKIDSGLCGKDSVKMPK